jgi:hypothetical protein
MLQGKCTFTRCGPHFVGTATVGVCLLVWFAEPPLIIPRDRRSLSTGLTKRAHLLDLQ